ncbi:4-amino-4-deoxy-L-arabinose transferase [Parafrankia irregularis]|uniref:4-amino-4-deoxy-L-arabinose transferase n=1 Tax=Parafrankia irregularis TaxID=795642 RepID=A0A0S4QI68_9ACTN|nr:hypothetical protein [Parafrankia irregularis]CUU54476.1 4-amino-4-deoxy-L-arabinose transferase [Parafrankia irregularis]
MATRRWLLLGVVAAGLTLSSVGLLGVLATEPFASADEAQHTAYAVEVGEGRLPELDTPVRATIPGMSGLPADCRVDPADVRRAAVEAADRPADDRQAQVSLPACAARDRGFASFEVIYTANHPPLFYLLESVPLRIGRSAGHPLAGFYAARILNLAVGFAALVATASLVRVLVPGRPDLAVAAAAITGAMGGFVAVTAQVYNDALAVTLITAATAATLVLLRRGPSARTLLAVAVLVPAAALSRASGAIAASLLVPMVGVAVGLAFARGTGLGVGRRPALGGRPEPGRRPALWRSALVGLAAAVTTGLLTVAAAGWFYLRNERLYGDLTATGRIASMFPTGFEERSAWQVVTSEDFWWLVYRGLFGRPKLLLGWPYRVAVGVGLLTLVGLLAAPVRAGLARAVARRAGHRAAGDAVGVTADGAGCDVGPARGTWVTDLMCWLVAGAQALIAVATLVGFVAAGGASFARYLLPALPMLAVAVAAGCSALPLARRGLPTVLVVGALWCTTIVMLSRELARHDPGLADRDLHGRLRGAIAATAFSPSGASLVVGVLLALAGLGIVLLTLSMSMLAPAAVPRWQVRPARGSAGADSGDGGMVPAASGFGVVRGGCGEGDGQVVGEVVGESVGEVVGERVGEVVGPPGSA